MFGRKTVEDGRDNLKSILSPVHITLEYLTWDRQMFQFKTIQKHLSNNVKYQNVLKKLEHEWPKMAKEYILKLDQRVNEKVRGENSTENNDIDFENSTLAPDLQRRLMLRYFKIVIFLFQDFSQNSQNNRILTIEDELTLYENELGTAYLKWKSKQKDFKTASIVDFYDEQKSVVPRLHKIVKLLSSVPCSSMPIESLFSIISNKLTRKTNRLSDTTLLNQLVTSFFYSFKNSVDQIL